MPLAPRRVLDPASRWPAPEREATPPRWAARRAALDELAATAFDDVLRAQNRLVARALGVSR